MSEEREAPRVRADRGVVPATVWLVLGFPLLLVWLVVVGWFGTLIGIDDPDRVTSARLALANTLFLVLAVAPFVVSAVLGVRVWRRGGRGGLVVAVLAALAALGVLLAPALGSL